jgi:uncharacterized repeat protein (TIGR01451 family)
MSLNARKFRVLLYGCVVLCGLLILLGSAVALTAAGDPPALAGPAHLVDARAGAAQEATQQMMHQYFVPFDDRDLRDLLDASDQCQPSPSTPPTAVGDFLASNLSITASSDETDVYYDHWEDGYDADPLNPGATTEFGTLAAGQVTFRTQDIDTSITPWGSVFHYDGRDRITIVGGDVAVVRSVAPGADSDIGARLAGAWEIEETADWGTEYLIPAGEDWGAGSDFEFTGATVTALNDGTGLFYNGTLVATLGVGGVYFASGVGDGTGLSSGDLFTATGPIQVHTYSSFCEPDAGLGQFPWWSGNGYVLEPVDQWNNDYWSPVPNRTSCSAAATDIFLYNDTGAPFNVTIDDGTPTTTIPLPPGSSSVAALIAPATLSTVGGVHISGDGPFWGVVNVDTRRWQYEWGYSLIPGDRLSAIVVLGWAPGNGNEPPTTQSPPSGNLAWVTPITDTSVFADFDQNGETDLIDCNGDGDTVDMGVDGICDEPVSDQGVPLLHGQTLRVADPGDADLTGALIYSGGFTKKIAVAWGEDPCVAEGGRPYLDLGYTVLPIQYHTLSITKADEPDPVVPGQLLTYTLEWVVEGDEFAPGVVVTDTLPLPYVSYVSCAGGLACGEIPPPGSGVVAWDLGDRLVPGSGITRESGTLTLTVQVEARPPGGVFTNTVVIDDETTRPPDRDEEPTTVVDARFELSKRRLTPSPVQIGDDVTYGIAITNTGVLTITRLPLQDTYDPLYLEFVSATPPEDTASPGLLTWDDLTRDLPAFGFTLPPGESTQVLVGFVALSSTQWLSPPLTINTAIVDGAQTDIGDLPRREHQAAVEITVDTAIELLYLRAGPKAGGVLVEWATLLELDTYGFRLYRGQDTHLANAVPVAFVAAEGRDGLGSAYQYLDADLPAGRYYYWLVEVENGGKETPYGPVDSLSGWDAADLPYRLYLPLVARP